VHKVQSIPPRIAFVGQPRYFLAAAFVGMNSNICGEFFSSEEPESNKLLTSLQVFSPDVIVVFRPDFNRSVLGSIRSNFDIPLLGYLTEPIETHGKFLVDNLRERRRFLRQNLPVLDLDGLICFLPSVADFAADFSNVISVMPLPVNDNLFSVGPLKNSKVSRFVFAGRINSYRNNWLEPTKHLHNPLIIENGMDFFEFKKFAKGFTYAGINLHVGNIDTFEHRALVYMAGAHLVVSELLNPGFGFLPDCEYVLVRKPSELMNVMQAIKDDPLVFDWVRKRGRRLVENNRASENWLSVLRLAEKLR